MSPSAIFLVPSPTLVYPVGSVARKILLTQCVCVRASVCVVLTGGKIVGDLREVPGRNSRTAHPAGLPGPAWLSLDTPEAFGVFFQIPGPGLEALDESPRTKLKALCCKTRGQANLECSCLPCGAPLSYSREPCAPLTSAPRKLEPSSSTIRTLLAVWTGFHPCPSIRGTGRGWGWG